MNTATFATSAHASRATTGGSDGDNHAPQGVGGALRALKVFAGAIFSVAVLGEYAEDAGVRRH
ncbi:hypothetical protein GCM10010232_04350 [Streptomyces amakusaensis]|uniref:Uncharacterized protein n=1 Tax=Streptomyces amakusaensis TaxID=67271 RepID=A0ABW0AJV4_9ACTN